MELETYIPRTLKHELQTRGRLPVDECVQIGLALTTALAHLHEHGLIHRDVKPSNIIFVNGVPKLADIGLVTDIEATRSFVGTEGFIPPEGPGTVSADLYSLGKVLYEISMGRSRLDFPALPVDWDEIPEADQARLLEFNEVLVKACESDATRRYASARQMHDELLLLQRGKSVKHKRAAEQRRKFAGKLAAATAVVALLAAIVPLAKILSHGKALDPEAVRLYKLGQHYYEKLTPEAHQKATGFLKQAVQIEPRFTDAYRLLFQIQVWFPDAKEKLRNCRELAAKLIELDPKLPEGHTALSWCKYMEGDWRAAEVEMKRVIQLDPDYALAHCIYGYYLSLQGRIAEAHRESRRAEYLAPTSPVQAMLTAYPYIADRQYDAAIVQLRRALELDRSFSRAHLFVARCYEAQSNYLEATDEFQAFDALEDRDAGRVSAFYEALREAYRQDGERGYWRKLLELQLFEESLAEAQKTLSKDDRWPIAGLYAKLGDKEKSLERLEKEFRETGPDEWLNFEPLYDTLRDEPRFQALLKRAGLEP